MPDTTPPPLVRCDGGPWSSRQIVRPGRTTGFCVMHSPAVIHCYDYVTNTTSGPLFVYRGTRTKTDAEPPFDVRYTYREG